MLYILWKAGAKPTTAWLEDVFADFEKGIIPDKVNKELPFNMKKLITNTFSMKKLNISNGELYLCGRSSKIELHIEPFELDGEVIETTIFMEDILLPIDIHNIENKEFVFKSYPEEGYIDGSVYLKNIHNPVTVKTIIFKEYYKHSNTIRAKFDVIFDFEDIDLKNETYSFNTVLYIK